MKTHWFFDRWCIELVLDEFKTIKEAAKIIGCPAHAVTGAILRVTGAFSIPAARRLR